LTKKARLRILHIIPVISKGEEMEPLAKWMLIILDCCVGCHACEIACRQEHDLVSATSSKWCRVATVKPRNVAGELHLDYFPTLCLHCEDPRCMHVCPNGAIAKRQDGIVVVDGENCGGCRLCVAACPTGSMSFNEVSLEAGKCNFCLDRGAYGLEPSCVQHCIGGALRHVTAEELNEITKGKHTASFGKVCYASSKWRLVSDINPA
jgi:Fe-S-cluster-containing dehydrogenase component